MSGRSTAGPIGSLVGLGYGLALWAILAVLIVPIWLSAVGFGMAPSVPNVAVESFVGHAVYGLVPGVTYAALARWVGPEARTGATEPLIFDRYTFPRNSLTPRAVRPARPAPAP